MFTAPSYVTIAVADEDDNYDNITYSLLTVI